MPRIAKDKTENSADNKIKKTASKKIEKAKKVEKTEKSKKVSSKNSTSKTKTNLKSKKTSNTTKTKKKTNPKKTLDIIEYYDLPYKYGNTLVKLLAQTPKTLFVYWEISNKDVEKYKKKFGEDFFNVTKPILIVRNKTLKKSYEVEINDFANCWYLNIEDPDCKYEIELARKFITSPLYSKKIKEDDYLKIAKSNSLRSPNNHILFENLLNSVTFMNIKTGEKIIKDADSYAFLREVYSFYKDLYKDELSNPSSGFVIY